MLGLYVYIVFNYSFYAWFSYSLCYYFIYFLFLYCRDTLYNSLFLSNMLIKWIVNHCYHRLFCDLVFLLNLDCPVFRVFINMNLICVIVVSAVDVSYISLRQPLYICMRESILCWIHMYRVDRTSTAIADLIV